MKTRTFTLFTLFAAAAPLPAAVDLKVDINEQTTANNTAANTEGGFQVMTLPTSVALNANASAAISKTFGAQTVTITPKGTSGNTPLFSARKRPTPTNNIVAPATFSQQALLQDFVFAVSHTGTAPTVVNEDAGLDITFTGLEAGKDYAVTVWSFDSGSSGTRVSDWSVNGIIAVDDYTFDGRVMPASNEQYQINLAGTADAGGNLVVSGRRDSTSVNAATSPVPSHGVFLNAFWIRDTFIDTDNDQMGDGWETIHGFVVGEDDSGLDADDDDFSNLEEYTAGSDPKDPDTDKDTLRDGHERKTGIWISATSTGSNPLLPDTDGDGLNDALENPDLLWTGPAQPGTDPNKYDTDGDQMGDGTEVNWPANPRDPLLFPHPGANGTLSVDLENTAIVAQPGFEGFAGTTDAAGTTLLTNTYGTRTVTITAVGDGSTTLRSRDRAAAGGGGDWNPLFRDFIYANASDSDGDGMDITITGLAPLTVYPVTLWSWDPTSAADPRRSTWLASEGDDPPVVKVPVYVLEGTAPLPSSPADRRMQFTARSNSAGELVIQGRKENGFAAASINVFLNAFVIGAAVLDSDGDLMPDAWETAHGLNPGLDDAALDPDTDQSGNLAEYNAGTDPQDNDSDDDTLLDGFEKKTGTWVSPSNTGTDPLVADTDGDGLSDGVENPDLPWTGPTQPGTDPNKYDTDGDSFGDGGEVAWPSSPKDPAVFPHPGAGGALSVDMEHTTILAQPGFEAFVGSGTGDAPELSSLFGTHNVIVRAVGTTALQSRDRAAAAGGNDFNPLFRDFIFCTGSAEENNGMDIEITGLAPLTIYPVTLWSWDPSSTATPRHSTWLSKDGGLAPVVKVPLYSLEGAALPAGPSDRRMQFTAATNAEGTLLIQGRKEPGYAGHTINVFLNAFVIGAAQGPFVPPPSEKVEITALGPWTPNGLSLTWKSEAGTRYKIEVSPDLSDWDPLNDNITGLPGTTSYTDNTAAGAEERFYRVSRVPPQ